MKIHFFYKLWNKFCGYMENWQIIVIFIRCLWKNFKLLWKGQLQKITKIRKLRAYYNSTSTAYFYFTQESVVTKKQAKCEIDNQLSNLLWSDFYFTQERVILQFLQGIRRLIASQITNFVTKFILHRRGQFSELELANSPLSMDYDYMNSPLLMDFHLWL